MSLDTKEIHVTERTVNRPPSLPMSQKPLSQDACQGGVLQTGQIWGHDTMASGPWAWTWLHGHQEARLT